MLIRSDVVNCYVLDRVKKNELMIKMPEPHEVQNAAYSFVHFLVNRRTCNHRSRIRYLSKKNSRILTNFSKLKKFVKFVQKFVKCPSGRGLPVE